MGAVPLRLAVLAVAGLLQQVRPVVVAAVAAVRRCAPPLIAEANGGANHSDNFFIASVAFNRSTGNRHDQLIAYIAGRDAAERAVAISRAVSGYSGPDAEILCRQGEEVFRAARAENRSRNE